MSSLASGKQPLTTSTMRTARELALLADLAAWAEEQDRCMAIIDRIYKVFDDLEQGLAPNASSRVLATEAARWVDSRDRSVAVTAEALHPFGHAREPYHG